MNKEWRDIKGYEGLYKINTSGEIISLKTNTKLRFFKNNKVYYRVGLSKNNHEKKYLVHRLVAETFIPNPLNLPDVNHKDENPLNINCDNLEWCTKQYNSNYGTAQLRSIEKRAKKVYQYDINGNLIKIWGSVRECRREGYTNVWYVCNKKSKLKTTYKNFIWSYTLL